MSLTVFWSATASDPRLHLTPSCSGLHRVGVAPSCSLLSSEVPSMLAFARLTTGVRSTTRGFFTDAIGEHATLLPCRSCALEPVLDRVLGAPPSSGPFVTFSALPSHAANDHRARAVDLTDTAADRLCRVARRAGLGVTGSRVGPVAYGMIRPSALVIVAANLKMLKPSHTPITAGAASVAWSLVDNSPRLDPSEQWDLWEVARAV